jgi:hypothetical protein
MGNGQLQKFFLHFFSGLCPGLDGEEQKISRNMGRSTAFYSGAKTPAANWSPVPRI